MSTAIPVPETIGLDGERAIATIRAAKVRLLAKKSFSRLRWADGLSHARAMAFQVVLTIIPGAIVLVAIATELHWDTLSTPIVQLARSLAPGPTGAVFQDAFGQGAKAGTSVSGGQAIGFAPPRTGRSSVRRTGSTGSRPTARRCASTGWRRR